MRLPENALRAIALAAATALVATPAAALARSDDADADGVADPADSCPGMTASTISGCPAAASTVSLKYSPRRKRFDGRVSSVPACVWNRTVTIFRRREGPDQPVVAAVTEIAGSFRVTARARDGRHYAIVGESVVAGSASCQSAVSPSFKVK